MAQSIGEQLKEARAQRGLTLEQVSQATHIRKHYLEALENDQREALPSAVQGRGFLRLYAGHLDLPVKALLAAWDGKAPAEPAVLPDQADAPTALGELPPGDQAGTESVPTADAGPGIDEIPGPVPVLPQGPAASASPTDFFSEGSESSQAIFYEIGQMMQKQREALGLTRAEVERFTRLRQHYIQALEEGQIEQLPSPVQGRGMLSNYVEFLNMDEAKVLLRFAEGLQARRIERIPRPEPGMASSKKRPARQAPFWRRFLTPDLIFGVAVAGIILFFALWTTARISNLRTTQDNPTPIGIGEVLLTPKADRTGTLAAALTPEGTIVSAEAAGTPEPTATATPVNDPAADVELTPADSTKTPSGGGQAGGQNQPKRVTLTPGAPPVTTPTLAPMNNDPLQVYIVARQRAWLRVVADDKIKFLGRTVPGNAYAFSGTKRIEMLTGDGSALEVYYNGSPQGSLGDPGEVVGLIFAPKGEVSTPTPAFTNTPTATLLATLTALPTMTPPATPSITPFIP
jgi:cytoskeletal protein RodZ